MFSVNGGQVLLTAGDTGLLAVIEKTLTPEEDGRVLLRFAHEDTEKLAQAEYVWDIRFALDAA